MVPEVTLPARTLALPGKLTMSTATGEMERLVVQLRSLQGAEVTLDGAGLEVFDSSAIAVLLELRRELMRQNRQLRVLRLPSRLRELMALYGVGELLPA